MTLSLDHVFICPEDARAAERALAQAGLEFDRHGAHRGQGTANACTSFANAFLELLWRSDDTELQSEVVRPLALWERVRWRETGALPFGIAFRPGINPPVETWAYEAPFLPAGATIPIVTPPYRAHEPLVFLSLVSPLPESPPRGRPELTRVTVHGPNARSWSPGIRALCDSGPFAVREAAAPLLELDCDGARGESQDFRPILPLVVHW